MLSIISLTLLGKMVFFSWFFFFWSIETPETIKITRKILHGLVMVVLYHSRCSGSFWARFCLKMEFTLLSKVSCFISINLGGIQSASCLPRITVIVVQAGIICKSPEFWLIAIVKVDNFFFFFSEKDKSKGCWPFVEGIYLKNK